MSDARVVEIDTRELAITPFFKVITKENVHKSERLGYAVIESQEVVEVRFAGTNNYAPVFPANAVWRREGTKAITYAERWPDQYRAFKEGNAQEAAGTPLEMLRPYGITPAQLSMCRAHRVYSIEALEGLQGQNLKSLGLLGNEIKAMAKKYRAANTTQSQAQKEIEALKARIAELEAKSTAVPEKEVEIFEGMTSEDLRAYIFDKAGSRPDPKLKHDALVNLAKGL